MQMFVDLNSRDCIEIPRKWRFLWEVELVWFAGNSLSDRCASKGVFNYEHRHRCSWSVLWQRLRCRDVSGVEHSYSNGLHGADCFCLRSGDAYFQERVCFSTLDRCKV